MYVYIYIYIYVYVYIYIYIYIGLSVTGLRALGVPKWFRWAWRARAPLHVGAHARFGTLKTRSQPRWVFISQTVVAIFYPFSQFSEKDIFLLSLQKQPNTAPNLFQKGGRIWQVCLCNVFAISLLSRLSVAALRWKSARSLQALRRMYIYIYIYIYMASVAPDNGRPWYFSTQGLLRSLRLSRGSEFFWVFFKIF